MVNLPYQRIRSLLKEYKIAIRTRAEAQQGILNHQYGKIGEKHHAYGKPRSEELKRNLSVQRIGVLNPMHGKTREDLSEKFTGEGNPFYNKKHSLETRKRLSGANNKNWRGGRSSLNKLVRQLGEYSEWRLLCLKRDEFLCTNCGTHKNLEVDHIKQMALILKENAVESSLDAVLCEELWDVNNGRTLCVSCHRATESHGRKID